MPWQTSGNVYTWGLPQCSQGVAASGGLSGHMYNVDVRWENICWWLHNKETRIIMKWNLILVRDMIMIMIMIKTTTMMMMQQHARILIQGYRYRESYTGRMVSSWWRQMETFSALLDLCAGNSPVPGEFPAQRPVTWSFDIFFDLRLNKRLSKQSWGCWFEMLSRPLWRHCNVNISNDGKGNADQLQFSCSLQWRHNEHDGISNHQPHDCLLNRLFRHISKKISKLHVTGLCAGNSQVTGEFPAQMASNAENVSIW